MFYWFIPNVTALFLCKCEHWILLKLLLVGSSSKAIADAIKLLLLKSPVQAINFSSLIIFFTLIFSLGRLLPLYKTDFIAFIPCIRSPLAVVNDLFISLLYHFPNFVLPLTVVGQSTRLGSLHIQPTWRTKANPKMKTTQSGLTSLNNCGNWRTITYSTFFMYEFHPSGL